MLKNLKFQSQKKFSKENFNQLSDLAQVSVGDVYKALNSQITGLSDEEVNDYFTQLQDEQIENYDSTADETEDPGVYYENDGTASVSQTFYENDGTPSYAAAQGLSGPEQNTRSQATQQDVANFKQKEDWRVRLSLAPGATYLYKDKQNQDKQDKEYPCVGKLLHHWASHSIRPAL